MAPVTTTRGYQSQAGNGSALSSDAMATQNPPNTTLSMTGGQSADLQERWTGKAQQYSPSYWHCSVVLMMNMMEMFYEMKTAIMNKLQQQTRGS